MISSRSAITGGGEKTKGEEGKSGMRVQVLGVAEVPRDWHVPSCRNLHVRNRVQLTEANDDGSMRGSDPMTLEATQKCQGCWQLVRTLSA